MGHANVDTTLNVYTQSMPGSHQVAVDLIAKELVTDCAQNAETVN